MLVGSPLLWLLPLLLLLLLLLFLFWGGFFSPVSEGQLANGTGYKERRRRRRRRGKKIHKLAGEAPCVYCAILVRRAAGAEWLLLVFIGAY